MAYPIPAGGYKRNVRDIARDLDSIEQSLPTAVKNLLFGIAERLLIEQALPKTPVDTGFMQSRWSIEDTAPDEVTVSNDTYYLPFVNTWSHPHFADLIAEETPGIAAEELQSLGFVGEVSKGATVKVAYNKPNWWARKAYQDPLKFAEHGRGVWWQPYQYEGT